MLGRHCEAAPHRRARSEHGDVRPHQQPDARGEPALDHRGDDHVAHRDARAREHRAGEERARRSRCAQERSGADGHECEEQRHLAAHAAGDRHRDERADAEAEDGQAREQSCDRRREAELPFEVAEQRRDAADGNAQVEPCEDEPDGEKGDPAHPREPTVAERQGVRRYRIGWPILQLFVAERSLLRAAVIRSAASTTQEGVHGGNWFPP